MTAFSFSHWDQNGPAIEIRPVKTLKHQETHRIAFLVEIQENSRKFKKIQQNSRKFKKIQQFIGRIVVRIELVFKYKSKILAKRLFLHIGKVQKFPI